MLTATTRRWWRATQRSGTAPRSGAAGVGDATSPIFRAAALFFDRAGTASPPPAGAVLGNAPDLRVPGGMQRAAGAATVAVDISGLAPDDARRVADEVASGLRGRGLCGIDQDGRLVARFDLTAEETNDERFLGEYVRDLLAHLHRAREAVVIASVLRLPAAHG